MDRLFSFIGDVADPVKGGGDTFTDRLNCRYTPCIFIIFALIITTKQYVGEPIACWCPDHFTHAQIEYTNQVMPYLNFNMESSSGMNMMILFMAQTHENID